MKRKIALGLVCLFTFTGGVVSTNIHNIYATGDSVATGEAIDIGGIDLVEQFGESIDGYIEGYGEFNDGLAWVKTVYFENDGAIYAYIDKTGKVVLPNKYEEASDFQNEVATVKLNGKYGLIDKTGKTLVDFKYDDANRFYNGLLTCSLNGKWGAVDKNGKTVIPFEYEALYLNEEGLMGFKKSGKMGFIDTNNNVIIENKYEDVRNFSEGFAGVKINGKWGFIDKTGKEVISPKYDDIGRFSENKAAVVLNKKCGFIDKTGKEIVPLVYDSVGNFKDNRAFVMKERNWLYIPENRKSELKNASFLEGYEDEKGIKYCEAFLDLNEKIPSGFEEPIPVNAYGYIDETGKEVIPCIYSHATQFENGIAGVGINAGGLAGSIFIDKSGKEVKLTGVAPEFPTGIINPFSEGYAISYLGNAPSTINIYKNPNYTGKQQTTSTTQNNNQITVNLNGKKIEFSQSPTVENGYTLVPMRNIFETLGAEVSWDQATRTVTAKKDDKEMKITVDSKVAKVNGSEYQLDVPARNINGSVLVPLRFIGEQLGVDVKWDGATKTVVLTTK